MTWSKGGEDREQAEIAVSGEAASIVEAHCQQYLRGALVEIDRLRAGVLTADRLKYEGALVTIKELVEAIEKRGPQNREQARALRNGKAELAKRFGSVDQAEVPSLDDLTP